MKKITVLLAALLYTAIAYSQNTFKAIIKDARTKEILNGATASVQATAIGESADTGGSVTLRNIPKGKQVIKFSYVGYETLSDTLTFPIIQTNATLILLQPVGKG